MQGRPLDVEAFPTAPLISLQKRKERKEKKRKKRNLVGRDERQLIQKLFINQERKKWKEREKKGSIFLPISLCISLSASLSSASALLVMMSSNITIVY